MSDKRYEWKGGGKTITHVVEQPTPAPTPAPVWYVTWGLELFSASEPIPVLDAEDVNGFRIPFRDKESAAHFAAEIQRFLGSRLLHLLERGRLSIVQPPEATP